MRSFSSIQAFFSARYLSLICSSLHPLCLSIVCATKFQATRRAPMAAERGFENDRVELAQVLYQPSQVLAPLGQLLVSLERLSWGLAAVVFTFTFARMWRESSGAGADLFWWFGRAVICLALMGSGPALISRLDTIGQAIAWGGSDGRSSVLYNNRVFLIHPHSRRKVWRTERA